MRIPVLIGLVFVEVCVEGESSSVRGRVAQSSPQQRTTKAKKTPSWKCQSENENIACKYDDLYSARFPFVDEPTSIIKTKLSEIFEEIKGTFTPTSRIICTVQGIEITLFSQTGWKIGNYKLVSSTAKVKNNQARKNVLKCSTSLQNLLGTKIGTWFEIKNKADLRTMSGPERSPESDKDSVPQADNYGDETFYPYDDDDESSPVPTNLEKEIPKIFTDPRETLSIPTAASLVTEPEGSSRTEPTRGSSIWSRYYDEKDTCSEYRSRGVGFTIQGKNLVGLQSPTLENLFEALKGKKQKGLKIHCKLNGYVFKLRSNSGWKSGDREESHTDEKYLLCSESDKELLIPVCNELNDLVTVQARHN